MPRVEDSTRSAKDLPRDLTCSWLVNSSTGDDELLTASPESVLEKATPGKFLDFTVNVACGFVVPVDPSKVKSGIILLI